MTCLKKSKKNKLSRRKRLSRKKISRRKISRKRLSRRKISRRKVSRRRRVSKGRKIVKKGGAEAGAEAAAGQAGNLGITDDTNIQFNKKLSKSQPNVGGLLIEGEYNKFKECVIEIFKTHGPNKYKNKNIAEFRIYDVFISEYTNFMNIILFFQQKPDGSIDQKMVISSSIKAIMDRHTDNDTSNRELNDVYIEKQDKIDALRGFITRNKLKTVRDVPGDGTCMWNSVICSYIHHLMGEYVDYSYNIHIQILIIHLKNLVYLFCRLYKHKFPVQIDFNVNYFDLWEFFDDNSVNYLLIISYILDVNIITYKVDDKHNFSSHSEAIDVFPYNSPKKDNLYIFHRGEHFFYGISNVYNVIDFYRFKQRKDSAKEWFTIYLQNFNAVIDRRKNYYNHYGMILRLLLFVLQVHIDNGRQIKQEWITKEWIQQLEDLCKTAGIRGNLLDQIFIHNCLNIIPDTTKPINRFIKEDTIYDGPIDAGLNAALGNFNDELVAANNERDKIDSAKSNLNYNTSYINFKREFYQESKFTNKYEYLVLAKYFIYKNNFVKNMLISSNYFVDYIPFLFTIIYLVIYQYLVKIPSVSYMDILFINRIHNVIPNIKNELNHEDDVKSNYVSGFVGDGVQSYPVRPINDKYLLYTENYIMKNKLEIYRMDLFKIYGDGVKDNMEKLLPKYNSEEIGDLMRILTVAPAPPQAEPQAAKVPDAARAAQEQARAQAQRERAAAQAAQKRDAAQAAAQAQAQAQREREAAQARAQEQAQAARAAAQAQAQAQRERAAAQAAQAEQARAQRARAAAQAAQAQREREAAQAQAQREREATQAAQEQAQRERAAAQEQARTARAATAAAQSQTPSARAQRERDAAQAPASPPAGPLVQARREGVLGHVGKFFGKLAERRSSARQKSSGPEPVEMVVKPTHDEELARVIPKHKIFNRKASIDRISRESMAREKPPVSQDVLQQLKSGKSRSELFKLFKERF